MLQVSELAALPPAFLVFAAGLIGLMVGSFLNVVIHRVPRMMEHDEANYIAELRGEPLPHPERYNLVVPRSACPHCGHQIAAWENIPIVSYLFLRGRCAGCKTRISVRYPLVELTSAVLSALAMWHYGPTVQALAALVMIWALIAATMIDADTQLLPDQITLPLLWLGLLLNLKGVFVPLADAVIGAAAGYLVLWSAYWLFKLVRGKEGMGYGDFKLMGALGAWFGWQALPALVLLSSVVGAVFGILMLVVRRQGRETPFPFGPFIAGAGLLVLFFGADLLPLDLGIH
ncbi:prepilin peptidase [Cupriavidus plantarum]|uniref:Prepilin leader peptidase/N-methyltransferase n=1 Tax=Cupriavidus plantarum TaxID=942865 RepID=A0A316EVC7_9BURK|nr:A24 family peptidase [Cupriavidus plantarum]NYH98970.1 leader peptidase (prepilin peptidase)/N-methyltransferase [Cupriavidus plantarum]PWK36196.1 type 4 prepilin peptidase 1 [Cupriavidus plantarum]REF03059.1 type 4 prepilin peptidase 1 [Cupriavidus plantarum]RLK44075.1 type 4 prepilin peptidase 1 [Cupriavidus plantarum]CAG2141357.1 Type 4 prepilin-like proteins leader peptide-processing enzyme [Cupriavidus plantarum]